jgi:hypothetical protein
MFQFGLLDDLLNFWSSNLDIRKIEEINKMPNSNLLEESSKLHPEVYLVTEYLKDRGEIPIFELLESRKLISKYFALIESSQIDIIWNKNTFLEDRWNINVYPEQFNEISYLEWSNFDSINRNASLDLEFIQRDRDL